MSVLAACSAAAFSSRFFSSMLVEPRAQHVPGLRAVLVLRALVLADHRDAGRDVGEPHRGFGLVDVLAAGAAASASCRCARRLLVDVDLDAVVDHRIDLDAGERRVPARVGIERRDAHQPVHAVLGLEPAVGVAALDLDGRRLDAGALALRSPRATRPCSRAARPSACTCEAACRPSPGSRCRRRRHALRDRRRWRRPRRRAAPRARGARLRP